MRRSVDRFCRNCGYEFQPDDTGECRMCARFEQSRIGFAVSRPSELASRQTPLQEPLDGDDPPSVDWPPTPAEYRAILAERRATTPSADGLSHGPAGTVIGALALPRPAKSAIEAPTAPTTGESPAPPKKKATARRKNSKLTAPMARESPAPPKKKSTARRRRPTPTAPTTGESPAPPKKKATARRNSRPTPTPPPFWPTPVLIRLRVPKRPVLVAMEAPTAALAGESPVPPETSTARRESRSTPPPTRESARSSSAAAEDNAALPLPDADRVLGARALPHHDASYGRDLSQIAFGLVIATMSAMIGAAVALLLS